MTITKLYLESWRMYRETGVGDSMNPESSSETKIRVRIVCGLVYFLLSDGTIFLFLGEIIINQFNCSRVPFASWILTNIL